jgi:predicted Rossmann fold flavoprotein
LTESKKVVVIGAGAAGIFAAINIAEFSPAIKVFVLEKSSKVLSKVKVSGGGRCNVTTATREIPSLIRNYPNGENFLKKAFHKFSSSDTVKWFESRGVKLKAEQDGRMFPVTNDSQTIVDCLLESCQNAGVLIKTNTGIRRIKRNKGSFILVTDGENEIACDAVVIATGGAPKTESYQWIRELGHEIEMPVPSLFTFNLKGESITKLQGVTVKDCEVKIPGTKLSSKGPVLITHWGFSGPAVLKLSAFGARLLNEMNYQYEVLVNWTGGKNEQQIREELNEFKSGNPKKFVRSVSPVQLPLRLWEFLTEKAEISSETTWNNLSGKPLNKLVNNLIADRYGAMGKTTFKEEFVTSGGVTLNEIDHNTMESKVTPGLFFCGEVLNIDGVTGGFNFQAAWTTGHIAAHGVVKALNL